MRASKLELLTPETIKEISRIAEETCDFYDCWCEKAVLDCKAYLDSIGLHVTPYFSGCIYDEISHAIEFGGCIIDWSHCYMVLDDGTILDPTIRQFLDSPRANPSQKSTVCGWPFLNAAPNVAVIPINHKFISKIGYESHDTGIGWINKPNWFTKIKTSC